MFSDVQLKLVAETLSNIGIVFFASLVIPIIIVPNTDFFVSLVGLAVSLVLWSLSLLMAEYVKS